MLLTNVGNKYIKLTSTAISAFLADIAAYSYVGVTGTYNCGTPKTSKVEDDLDGLFPIDNWGLYLHDAVFRSEVITRLVVVNTATGKESNIITTPIDLGYVIENCANDACVMSDYDTYFANLFKTQIDAFFNDNCVPGTNVSIGIVDNTVFIEGIPAGFHLKEVSFESDSDPIPALYADEQTDQAADSFFLGQDGIYVTSALFSQTVYKDGIYSIELTLKQDDTVTKELNCLFMDITFKCKVAAFLSGLITASEGAEEKPSTTVHLLHYGLVNGSNCGCYCDEMCLLFNELDSILTDYQSEINANCGC